MNGPQDPRVDRGEHARWNDDRAAYLLGALDEDERAAFEDHLADCERCRAELRWLAPAVDVLPAAVEQRAPPPGLRGRILEAVERGGARQRVAREPPAARRSLWSRLPVHPAFAAGALVAALAVGFGAGYVLRGDSDGVSGPPAGTKVVPLVPTRLADRANGRVVHRDDTWVLDVSQMPKLGRGYVYQVWMRRKQDVWPTVVFVLSPERKASVLLPYESADRADAMLVTREPGGGSEQPTSAPLVWAALRGE